MALAMDELDKWWTQPDAHVNPRVLDVFDGAQPGLSPPQPQATRSSDGRLWFANNSVLQMVDPSRLSRNPLPPPVLIERVIADQKIFPTVSDLSLPALTRDLEIDYAALSFVIPEKVRYRYKLEGRDSDWQEAGTRRQAFYSDLRPGQYRFTVIASNNDGLWNDVGATLNFSVAPAWYQTNWFLLLCAAAALFLIWSIYRLRVRQIARAFSIRFDERLAERTRVARELHDTLLQTVQGSKMVADDALEQNGDPAHLRRVMEQLSTWLGQAVNEGRAALSSLRTSTTEKNDLAAALRRATDSCVVHGSIEPTFSVVGDAKDMHPIVRDEIYRIGFEAIRNACTHSEASHVEVELRYERDLVVRVKDNGKGIDSDIVSGGKEAHFGLKGMRERTARIGAEFTLNTSVDSGTEIILVVPGGIAYRHQIHASEL
jgi:signal transduction histidine kinase